MRHPYLPKEKNFLLSVEGIYKAERLKEKTGGWTALPSGELICRFAERCPKREQQTSP
jgi:hypothetical protein